MKYDPALSIEEKKQLAKKLLLERQKKEKIKSTENAPDYKSYTYDMFLYSMGQELSEMQRFSHSIGEANKDNVYPFEAVRTTMQTTEVDLIRSTGEKFHLLNFSSYNYLGFGCEAEVIKAAQKSVAKYGLGATSSPVISGTYGVHKQLEDNLVDFFGMSDRGISLFSSGYAVNLGTIQAFIKPGNYVVCDRNAHMSILEGAKLSGGQIEYFDHNDVNDLEKVLERISDGRTRILVCVEGVYSADGDYGNLKQLIKLTKKYGAYMLVDEAHSILIAGEHGRGVAEEQGVLEDVDLYVMTFSKAFSGVGGALLAKKDIITYINWYAKCRMFSCALDPGVTGGMLKVLELARSEEGYKRRKRIHDNAAYLSSLLSGKVDLGCSESWIVTVMFGDELKTFDLYNFLQHQGIDVSIMQFPAVPKNESRIRLFVTSEHTKEQLDKAAEIILDAAQQFEFLL